MLMKARVLTLRYDPLLAGFDEAPLREFQTDIELLGVRDHLFEQDGQNHLALVLTYRAAGEGAPPPMNEAAEPARRQRWQELVGPDDLPLFNTLREWRAARAKKEGFPPYVICTNRQLALLVRARPQGLAKMAEVEGFGKAKLERFGSEMLAIFKRASPGHGPSRPPDAGQAAVAVPETMIDKNCADDNE